jgi:hypothetical protein
MPERATNVGASVRARLQNLSRDTGQSFELVLTRYALERLLYRLGASAFADRFVLCQPTSGTNPLPTSKSDPLLGSDHSCRDRLQQS